MFTKIWSEFTGTRQVEGEYRILGMHTSVTGACSNSFTHLWITVFFFFFNFSGSLWMTFQFVRACGLFTWSGICTDNSKDRVCFHYGLFSPWPFIHNRCWVSSRLSKRLLSPRIKSETVAIMWCRSLCCFTVHVSCSALNLLVAQTREKPHSMRRWWKQIEVLGHVCAWDGKSCLSWY